MAVFLIALAMAGLTGWIVEAVANGTIDRAVSAFRELIGGWRADPWPRGVQEEDRDRPWGRGLVAESVSQATQAVATAHVRGRTRARQ